MKYRRISEVVFLLKTSINPIRCNMNNQARIVSRNAGGSGDSQAVDRADETTNRCVKLDELSVFMPFFSGSPDEDVNFFINTVEQTRKTFNVEKEVMKLMIFKHLRSNAKVWLSSQPDLFTKDYLDVLNLIKTTFEVVVSPF